MSQLCPHCKQSTQFKVTLLGEGLVELKNDAFELISQGELSIQDGTLVCASCNQPVANDQLVPALECSDCHVITPVENMVQLQNEDGSEGAVICTTCYAKMTTPAPEEMDKEQLVELAKSKDTQMAEMQAQMAQMMAQMQQMQQMVAQSAPPAQEPVSIPQQMVQQTPPTQEPVVSTNLPMPNAINEMENVIDPGTMPQEENVASFFGGDAPF